MSTPTRERRRSRGFTLIELVVSIVIIAVAVTGVMLGYATLIRGSADPMVSYQAVAIAEAYLEEITSKSFYPGSGSTRAEFDDVLDYNGRVEPPHDSSDTPIAELAGYQVSIAVAAMPLNGEPAYRIAVTVSDGGSVAYTLVGYRTGHF